VAFFYLAKGFAVMEISIAIRDDVIKLQQFLKLADAVATGGEAKLRVQNGEVLVNGEVETRRGRKLRDGDIVSLEGTLYIVARG
jgi:ribosome-associated protein